LGSITPQAEFPTITADETAAGPADDGRAQLAEGVEHVAAETFLVREWRTGVEDTPIDLAVEVLQEAAENHAVVRSRRGVGVDDDKGLWRKAGGAGQGVGGVQGGKGLCGGEE
jgi:hypothetical protein